jgi:hypothetical protein
MSESSLTMNAWMQAWGEAEDGISRSRRSVLTGTLSPRQSREDAQAAELLSDAMRLFDTVGTHLSERVSQEELGDALEDIQRMIAAGEPEWKVHARILSTLFWVSAHSVQDYFDPV